MYRGSNIKICKTYRAQRSKRYDCTIYRFFYQEMIERYKDYLLKYMYIKAFICDAYYIDTLYQNMIAKFMDYLHKYI